MNILNQYEQDGFEIIEYTKDGTTVSHSVKTPILQEVEPVEPQPTTEEMQTQTLLNTEYLVTMSELKNL